MKYLLLLLIIVYFGVCDEHTLNITQSPTLGDVIAYDSTLSYTHTDTNDIQRSTLDSFTLVAIDNAGNISNNTKLYVLIVPKLEMQTYIVPNPLEIVGNNVKDFIPSFNSNFNISIYGMENKGSAVVLIFDRKINEYESNGRIRVLDAVGNVITDYLPIHFGTNSNGQSIGVCVWNGRNLYDRVVGPASYVVYIEVHVVAEMFTDDGVNEINETYIKVIGVKYK